MKNRTMNQLTQGQQAAIQAAVSRAESRTSGEIVPIIAAQSDAYREGAVQAAAVIAAALALTVSFIAHDTSIWLFLPTAFVLYVPLLAVTRRYGPIKLAFTPAARIAEAVRSAAIRTFHEHGLHRTRDANGILIFVSLLEHRVWILGDRGINAVIPPERWISLATGLAAGIRRGEMTESLVSSVDEVGEILCRHFPRREDDTNELPDLLQ